MIRRLLIANRGEIACRIMRTAKKLGITCIAIYSEADNEAQHVKQADEAYYIGPAASRDSYLHIDNIIQLAKLQKIDAIHPGYGFLSENTVFAARCAEADILFVGPSAKAIELMGNKNQAKRLLASTGIPLLPSYYGEKQDLGTLQTAAEQIGFPVLLKAAAGGGGKGMRVVNNALELPAQLAAAKREALANFNNDEILIEKFLANPRHIEVQIFADHHGNTVHLFDRDCSIQRRYQKIIEEAPAPNISDKVRQQLYAAAIKAAQAIDYVGAGTLEFLLDEHQQFYFMEMNTRLQVEHPVTEMITGYDLVEWQLKITAGEALPVKQSDIKIHGHALEVRICAENPQDFLPSAGHIHFLQFSPTTPQIRIDSGIVQGDTITTFYDSLLAKLIVHAPKRQQAITDLTQALQACQIIGIQTNLPLLNYLTVLPDFKHAQLHTHLIAEQQATFIAKLNEIEATAWLAAGLFMILQQQQTIAKQAQLRGEANYPWYVTDGWRLNTSPYQQTIELKAKQQQRALEITYLAESYVMKLSDVSHRVSGYLDSEHYLHLTMDGVAKTYRSLQIARQLHLINSVNDVLIFEQIVSDYAIQEQAEHSLRAQLPGTLVALFVQAGDTITKGMPLLAIEAMKMEHVLRAPYDGQIAAIYYQVGEQVAEGAQLLNLMELTDEITN
jgi:3-methylcrotonyl-CoA carboxylase alpha subunit